MKSGEKNHEGIASRSFRSSWDCAKWIAKEGGISAFYRGALINTYRATGAALCIALYDKITYWMEGVEWVK